ncbi:hypothetical protein F1559_003452 [Cyanidiococcus yangmingshanensis]|uniref:sphingomyelin phosphodiesterase n=1 Tax=Cyanidiococcus yangmingshanensis TaxID=2690220 RepID=A0A7J7IHL0_9RHOD|nr:hypothetical protein F1559_003452 [Cyanidiococcus yangmingshanensis]
MPRPAGSAQGTGVLTEKFSLLAERPRLRFAVFETNLNRANTIGFLLLFLALIICYRVWLWRLERLYECTARQVLVRANAAGKLQSAVVARRSVRLLSYNVFVRPPGVSARGNDFKDERLGRLLAYMVLSDLDVVALQELFRFGSPRQQAFCRVARRLGGYRYSAALPYPPRGRSSPPRVLDGGVTILSRFPIERVAISTYRCAHWHFIDCIVAKGVLCAHIRIPLGNRESGAGGTTTLAVFATHAQAGNVLYPGIRGVRRKQVQQLRAFVQQEAGRRAMPVVVCGDLNVNGMHVEGDDRDSPEYVDMLNILNGDASTAPALSRSFQFRDLLKEAYHGRHPATVDAVTAAGTPREPLLSPVNSHKQPKRLDYVLCDAGPGMECTLKQAKVEPFFLEPWDPAPFRQLSDHDAVLVEMEFVASSGDREHANGP